MNDAQIPLFGRGKCWLLIGPRGSGKSKFAEFQVKGTPHTIVIDTKGDYEIDDPWPRYHVLSRSLSDLELKLDWILEQPPATHYWGAPVIFKVPGPKDGVPVKQQRAIADQAARLAMRRGHTQLYYDELAQAVPGTNYEQDFPYYQSAVQQGRSLGVGVGASTQRPSRIPLIAGSEADYRVTWFLRHPGDRKIAEEYVGGPVPWTELGRIKHSFVIGTDDDGDAELEPHRLII